MADNSKVAVWKGGLGSYASNRVFPGVRALKGKQAAQHVIRAKAAKASLGGQGVTLQTGTAIAKKERLTLEDKATLSTKTKAKQLS